MRKAFFQLHIAVLLAGFTAIFGNLILLNEGLLVWYRLLLSVIVIGIALRSKNKFEKIDQRDFIKITAVGLILALHWVLFYGSIKYANVSVGVVCLSAAGFFSSILEPVLLKTKFVFIEFIFGLIGLLGVYIIFDFHPQYKTGIIFGLLSALGSACFPMYNKKLLNRFNPITLTFYEFLGGLLMLTVFLPFYFIKFPPQYFIPTSSDLCWLLLLVVFCTVLAFVLQLRALKKISAFTSNLTYNLEPVYGVFLAFLIFNEHKLIDNHFYLGVAFIILAIGLQMIRVLTLAKMKKKIHVDI
jgi:drug/metabolite transporter (DMT)-like permease